MSYKECADFYGRARSYTADFPFDMGDPDPLGTVEKAGLTPEALKKVCWQTAEHLFRLTV